MISIVAWGGLSSPPRVAAAVDQPVTILMYPAKAPPAAAVFVRVRIVNTGSDSFRECRRVDGQIVPDGHCLILGYRFWRTPARMALQSIDAVKVLATGEILAPGASVERTVRLQTPRSRSRNVKDHVLHMYLVRGPRDALEWTHVSVPLSPGAVPVAVRLREWVTLFLLALYVSSLAWAVWRAVREWWMQEVPACLR